MKKHECSRWNVGCLLAVLLFIGACTDTNQQPTNRSSAKDSTGSPAAAKAKSATSPTQQTAHLSRVEIKDMKFNPEVLTVHKGDTVVWVNNDLTNHCVSEANKAWTSSTITPGSSWKRVVTGNTNYFCAIHVVMKGKLKVE